MATVIELEVINNAITITAVLSLGSQLIVAFFLNYVPRVRFPEESRRSFTTVYICFAYWMTIGLFFLASANMALALTLDVAENVQGEDRKKWPPMKIGFLDYNCVKRAENVEKFINRTVQLPNMTEGLTLLSLKCNFHHTNR